MYAIRSYYEQALIMGISGLIASFGGAAVASYLPASTLSTIFGVVIILGALKTYTTPAVKEKEKIRTNPVFYIFGGLLIGFFSGLLGIGGGVVGIPVMLILLHFDMRKAVGTSAAIMLFTRNNFV